MECSKSNTGNANSDWSDLLAFSADDANLIVESLSLIANTETLVGNRDVVPIPVRGRFDRYTNVSFNANRIT